MEDKFRAAIENELISDPAQEIYHLWQFLGSPNPPVSLEIGAHVPFSWLNEQHSDGSVDEVRAVFNKTVVQLLELCGLSHHSGETWHTAWDYGTIEWERYKRESREIAYDFLRDELWEHFSHHT